MTNIRILTAFAMCIVLVLSACQNESGPVTPKQNLDELSVSLTADPAMLPNDDPNIISTITATVTDANGVQVGGGVVVSFTTTIGTIAPEAITDSEGQATVILRPDEQTGEGDIYGFVGDHDNGKGGHANILVADPRIPVFIEVDASPNLISVSGTGQNSVSAITATVRNALGGPVMAEREVLFELINEPRPPRGLPLMAVQSRKMRASPMMEWQLDTLSLVLR